MFIRALLAAWLPHLRHLGKHEFRSDSTHSFQYVAQPGPDFQLACFDAGDRVLHEYAHIHPFLPLRFLNELTSEQWRFDPRRSQLDRSNSSTDELHP
jgi:hypothetical protein